MVSYISKRLLLLVPTIFGISIFAFLFVHVLPGDPIEIMAGERSISPERHAALLAKTGLDKPLLEQYVIYVGNLFNGDLGTSFVSKRPVVSEFFSLFPATVELSFVALMFALLMGIPAGAIAAVKRGSWFDHCTMTASLVGYSMPIFWWALLLIILFSGGLNLTPVSGRISLLYYFESNTGFMLIDSLLAGEYGGFVSALHHLILPAIVLGTIPLAVIARHTRSAMLEVLNEDYIRTAKAKGLPQWRVIFVHALRNALIPVITTIGLQVGVLLGGAILTETIFSWPGIGKWMVDSIFSRDYPAVQGGLLFIALIVMLVNLTVDIIYGLVNPQIRG